MRQNISYIHFKFRGQNQYNVVFSHFLSNENVWMSLLFRVLDLYAHWLDFD